MTVLSLSLSHNKKFQGQVTITPPDKDGNVNSFGAPKKKHHKKKKNENEDKTV